MSNQTTTTEVITYVNLKDIVYSRYQPRTTMDPAELKKLAQSIQDIGLMQTPTARLLENGCYELAFGHRRFEAYKLLASKDKSFGTMPLIIRVLNDEQMFDLAWDENQEREDINPIDEGNAYATWMREFNKTSKEAGMRFKTSEENIRAKVRLGKLPEAVKDKVRSGEINETTARALLQMQRVASPEVVERTAEEINKRKGDRTPEQVIEHTVEHLDNVVELWDENNRNGKPRAGYHGWPLDMKKFPNKLLPAMTVQGVAKYEQQIEHFIEPPTCNTCPFYTKVRGSHFCGLKDCYERKTIAWGRYQVEQASKSTGIAIYSDEDGAYRPLGWSHKALVEKKNKHLRLMPKPSGSYYQDFKGLDDDVVIVVATGETLGLIQNTGSGKTVGGKKTELEKAEMRAMKIYRRYRKQLLWDFAGIAKTLLGGVPFPVLEHLERNVSMDDRPLEEEPDDDAKLAVRTEYLRQSMMYQMCIESTGSSHYRRESMAELIESLQEETKDWGVKIPKGLIKCAEVWDAEIGLVFTGLNGKAAK